MAMSNNNTNGFKQKKICQTVNTETRAFTLTLSAWQNNYWGHCVREKYSLTCSSKKWSMKSERQTFTQMHLGSIFFLLLHTNRKQGNWVCEHAERNVFTLMLLWIKHCHVIAVGQLLRKCISTPVWFTFDCWENANHADTIACWIKSVWGDA